jgi:hypothetical protein
MGLLLKRRSLSAWGEMEPLPSLKIKRVPLYRQLRKCSCKLSVIDGKLAVNDYLAPSNVLDLVDKDLDLSRAEKY